MYELIIIILLPFTWGFEKMARILSQSGALPIFIVLFFIGVVVRLIIKPFIGEAHNDND